MFGGVPVQSVFQRLLSVDSVRTAHIVGVAGGICSSLLIIPPILIGAIGASTGKFAICFFRNKFE